MQIIMNKKIETQIIKFIQGKIKEANAKGIVVGLSGGIDSAVASVLALKAVGKENILGVIMPCESNPQDEKDAIIHAKEFEIKTKIINLEENYFSLKNAINIEGNQLSKANLKPRLRMCALYYISNSLNYLVLGTCNKSEIMVGYETKFGDGGSDLSPIGDLYKFQVKRLAEYLGINQNIITKPPSAGLWNNQTDEEELGMSYQTLDNILTCSRIEKYKNIVKVYKLIANSAHKRRVPDICIIK